MEPPTLDSIDIVIADITSQPIASKAYDSFQKPPDINLSASNLTIGPAGPSSSVSAPHFLGMHSAGFPIHPPISSSDLMTPATEFLPHQDHAPETGQNKETKETKEYNDEQIIVEALRSAKDRLFVLKLGDSMENLIAERESRTRQELPSLSSSYHRLLVHRCAAWYKLTPETDPATKIITVCVGPESRTPARRVLDLVPLETPAVRPTFQIMRRAANGRSARSSIAGDDTGTPGDLSDVDASETGSSRSGAKKHLTISQREAAYNEARSRIFMGFQNKSLSSEKPHSASASSSNLSAESSSVTSAGGGSSAGELDDGASTAPTESDRSHPAGQPSVPNKRPGREKNQNSRKTSNHSSTSQPRHSSRGNEYDRRINYDYNRNMGQADSPIDQPEYHHPGPGVDPQTGLFLPALYNQNRGMMQPPEVGYHETPSPQGYEPGSGYPPYPYPTPYPPYGYYPFPYPPPPAAHLQNYSDSQRFPPNEQLYPAQSHEGYGPVAYLPVWAPPGPQGPSPNAPPNAGQMQNPQQEYHPNPTYPPPPQGFSPAPFPAQHQAGGLTNQQPLPASREPLHQVIHQPDFDIQIPQIDVSRGCSFGNKGSISTHRNPSMGPRSNNTKRPSSNRGGRSPGDNSSIASSSSSSSRRTPGSATSHPLPARPDWAVGLLPQGNGHGAPGSHPNARPPNEHHHSLPIHQLQQSSGPDLGEFPPLSYSTPPSDRPALAPSVSGAWMDNKQAAFQANPVLAQPFFPNPLHPSPWAVGRDQMHDSLNIPFTPQISQSTSYSSSGSSHGRVRFGEEDHRFERPRPRGNVELFNPKAKRPASEQGNQGASPQLQAQNLECVQQVRQRAGTGGRAPSEAEKKRCDAVKSAILIEKLENVSLTDGR